jgi:hypothetical protein
MKILSIDVGIKNLAFCLLETCEPTISIIKWDVIDISESDTFICNFSEKQNICNKPAKYKHPQGSSCYCLKHAKKQSLLIPSPDFDVNNLKKNNMSRLYDFASEHNLQYKKPIQKDELISIIQQFTQDKYLQLITKKNAAILDMVTIGTNIKIKLDAIFANEEYIDYVIIENQISPIANRMKTVQGMLAQYFIMSKTGVNRIEFVSACNKLKECDLPQKTTYSERKKLSIIKCLEILNNENVPFIEFYSKHQKKDDLADCFLQGRWYIKEKIWTSIKNK